MRWFDACQDKAGVNFGVGVGLLAILVLDDGQDQRSQYGIFMCIHPTRFDEGLSRCQPVLGAVLFDASSGYDRTYLYRRELYFL